MSEASIPEGFAPLFRTSPLLETLGPFYSKGRGEDLVVALRVAEKHANARGALHGGVTATIADVAMGYAMAFGSDPPRRMVTASMTIDYTGGAEVGDWVEVHIDRTRVGRTLAFCNAYLMVGATQVARASGVFAIVADRSGG